MNSQTFGGKWLQDLNKELHGSDRACAVLAGAILDERLKRLLSVYLLPPTDSKNDRLLGRSAPIDSFSSRIELTRRLNLISEKSRKALSWVRNIRNDAAHEEDFTFESQSYIDRIKNLINELQIKEKAPSILAAPYDNTKGKFIAVITIMVVSLELEIKQTIHTTHMPTDAVSNFTANEKG